MDPTGNTQNGYIAYPFLTTRMPWWSGARLGVGGSDLYGRPIVPSERLTELELAAISATMQNLETRVTALEARVAAFVATAAAAEMVPPAPETPEE